jgi:hypothetical protein
MPDISPPCDYEKADEEANRGNGEHGDCFAQRGADLRRRAGSGVAAHAATLRVCGWDTEKENCCEAD